MAVVVGVFETPSIWCRVMRGMFYRHVEMSLRVGQRMERCSEIVIESCAGENEFIALKKPFP